MPQDASGGVGSRTYLFGSRTILGLSYAPQSAIEDEWGGPDGGASPEAVAFERDWNEREMEAARILGLEAA